MTLIQGIKDASDLKNLTLVQIQDLVEEIRELYLEKFQKISGHVGSNLGSIEPITAMHYVFNSPEDKFIFDVSHQCYAHKILTGRWQGFQQFGSAAGFSGYLDPSESIHDLFYIGHAGSSISYAAGLAKSRDLKHEKYNVIAFIGDGSLSEGEAYEGLNFASTMNSNLIIILNDNEMSINENVGGLYENLRMLRVTNGDYPNNFFKIFGFDYRYVENGNNVLDMIHALTSIADIDHPIVVHIHTTKGYGYKPAIANKARWHYGVTSKTWLEQFERDPQRTFINFPIVLSDWLDERLEKNEIVVIEPATPLVLQYLRYKHPTRFVDTGMNEAFAATYAAAIAKGGIKPYLIIDPGFLQRAYDQVAQNIAMQNLNVSIIIVGGAIECVDQSHVAMYDIPMLSNIPNITYMAPTSYYECKQMLDFMKDADYPTALRLGGRFVNQPDRKTPAILFGKAEILSQGQDIAVIGVGKFLQIAIEVSELLSMHGFSSTVINPRFISSVDCELLDELSLTHSKFITIEDGVVEGGFGQKVTMYMNKYNISVRNYGAAKEFTHYVQYNELINRYRLNPVQIVEDIIG
jgi:1-deoxy-D-xylulose-5-phosphate synthase